MESEVELAQEAEERRAEVEMEQGERTAQLRRYLEQMSTYHKACEQQKSYYERLRRKRDTVQSVLPPLIAQYEHQQRLLTDMQVQHKRERALLREIKQDEELFISQYLSQERLEEDTGDLLFGVEEEGREYEEKIRELAMDERLLQKRINHISSQVGAALSRLIDLSCSHNSFALFCFALMLRCLFYCTLFNTC
jgi:hypothetical protein